MNCKYCGVKQVGNNGMGLCAVDFFDYTTKKASLNNNDFMMRYFNSRAGLSPNDFAIRKIDLERREKEIEENLEFIKKCEN